MLCVPPAVNVSLDGRPVAVHRGPKIVHQLIGDGASIAFVRDAVLITTELVTIATDDTDGCELSASFDGRQLRVEVSDIAACIPVCRLQNPDRGVGLRLVHRLASRWGAKITGSRAIVWFELDAHVARIGKIVR